MSRLRSSYLERFRASSERSIDATKGTFQGSDNYGFLKLVDGGHVVSGLPFDARRLNKSHAKDFTALIYAGYHGSSSASSKNDRQRRQTRAMVIVITLYNTNALIFIF